MKQLLTLIFLFVSINLFAQNRNYTVDTVEIKSSILNETRKVIIYKPFGIENKTSVNFLYLLDGEYSNHLYKELDNEFGESISDLIVIGIMNPERRRDMLYIKGAKSFLDFITSELTPVVEKDYQVTKRVLNGHSFCGSFTIYSLLNKPESFDCFIATSPTPIMDLVNLDSYLQVDSSIKQKISFYFSYGSKDMKQVKKWSKKLNENLTGQNFNHIDWKSEIHDGKNHNDSDVIALLHGLKLL